VTTGGYQSWRDVGSFGALIHTTFGRLLLVKIAIVVVVLGLGNIARRWVHRNLVSAPAPTRPGPLPTTARGSGGLLTLERPATENLPLSTRNLQRGLIAESVIGLLVLVITAALVVTVPARASYVKSYQRSATVGDVTLSVRVDERRVGDTILHVKVKSADGRPSALTALRGSLTRKAGALGPLPLRLPDADGATATGSEDIGLTFPAGGAWTLQLTVQTSEFDAAAFSFTVPIE
jgi:copper transport protein